MKSLVICLEEFSARVFLEILLPTIIDVSEWDIIYLVFEGKQDLMKNLPRRLKTWQNSHSQFLILRDQDSENCIQLKQRISKICLENGKPNALIRIACHELETFYLGDLRAVSQGLNCSHLEKLQNTSAYRAPDSISNAKQQLKKITHGTYREVGGSRSISAYLDINNNRSQSFRQLVVGIQRLCVNQEQKIINKQIP